MSTVRGRPFAPGNKMGRGRQAGSRNNATILLQQNLDEKGVAIMAKAQVMALQGDHVALRLCVDRLLPARKDSLVQFKLPAIRTAEDLGRALEAVLQGIAGGKLTPAEGECLSAVLERRRKSIETADIEARVRALEDRGLLK
jgi:hypothetical protein